MLQTVLPARDSIQEGHPEVDPCFFQLSALLDDIAGMVAFVHPVQCPVIATFHAEGDLPEAQFFQMSQLFYGFIADVCHSGGSVDVFHLRKIMIDHLQDRHQFLIGQSQWIG